MAKAAKMLRPIAAPIDSTEVLSVGELRLAAEVEPDFERVRQIARILGERAAQLETALRSRIVIEQAKGVLAERLGVSIDEAFELLRRGARSNRMKIHDLAAVVLSSPGTPPEIENEVEPSRL